MKPATNTYTSLKFAPVTRRCVRRGLRPDSVPYRVSYIPYRTRAARASLAEHSKIIVKMSAKVLA